MKQHNISTILKDIFTAIKFKRRSRPELHQYVHHYH